MCWKFSGNSQIVGRFNRNCYNILARYVVLVSISTSLFIVILSEIITSELCENIAYPPIFSIPDRNLRETTYRTSQRKSSSLFLSFSSCPHSIAHCKIFFEEENEVMEGSGRNADLQLKYLIRSDKPFPIGRSYWSRWVAIYPPRDRIWFCSSRCPRSLRGRPRNRHNPQGQVGGARHSRWHFARQDCCRVDFSEWPVGRGPDDHYWRGPTAAAASTAESLEGDAEGNGPRALVPRLSPPSLEDRKRDSLSWSIDNISPDFTISRWVLTSAFLHFRSFCLSHSFPSPLVSIFHHPSLLLFCSFFSPYRQFSSHFSVT